MGFSGKLWKAAECLGYRIQYSFRRSLYLLHTEIGRHLKQLGAWLPVSFFVQEIPVLAGTVPPGC